MAKVGAAGKKHGIPVGYPAGSPAEINKRIARGKRFFQADNELSLLRSGARELLSKLQRGDGHLNSTCGVRAPKIPNVGMIVPKEGMTGSSALPSLSLAATRRRIVWRRTVKYPCRVLRTSA